MDNSLKGFLKLSLGIISIFFVVIVLFAFFYQYSTLNTYNYVLLFLTIVTIIIMLIVVFSVSVIVATYKTRKANKLFVLFIKFGLKILLPFLNNISNILNCDKDSVRQFYIDLNNVLVQQTVHMKYLPEEVLMILPHCLQNSKCEFKVTGDINNCRRCGKCCIGEIADTCDEIGVVAEIVTGGTVARNIVNVRKPKIILSVACERDLASGISDISNIPVLGIINERPNGPCCNTNVDTSLIRAKLGSIVDRKK